jgi:hypothetical protein
MLKSIFYAILLGVGMAACLTQDPDEDNTEAEQIAELTTAVTEETGTQTPSPENFIIQQGQVGNIKIGMPINVIRTNVEPGFAIADTTLMLEGQAYTAYKLYPQRQPEGILIEQQCEPDCLVWRIQVKSNDYKTSKGIGIESKYSEVQQFYPIQSVTLADGGLVAVSENPRISFVLDTSQIPDAQLSKLTPENVPANTLVKSILIY